MRDAGHRTPDAGHRTAKKAKIIYPPPRGVDIIRSSWTRTASTLFYTKRSRVSRIRAITDRDKEKRTGVVPTLVKSVRILTMRI